MAHKFSGLRIWKFSKDFKLDISVCTFSRYFAIVKFWGSNSPFVWLATSWKSINALSLLISNLLAILSLAKSVSYSTWLFDALKVNQSAYSATTPLKFVRINPTLLPSELDAPSMWSIHVASRHSSSAFSWLTTPPVSFWLTSSWAYMHFTMKSAKTWAFIIGQGR